MNEKIANGAIIIALGPRLPVPLQPQDRAFVEGRQYSRWLDPNGSMRRDRLTGWNVLSVHTTIEMRVLGFDDNKAIHEANHHIVARCFNCLEVERVESLRCLGIPYVLVAAHSWHIQAGSARAVKRLL